MWIRRLGTQSYQLLKSVKLLRDLACNWQVNNPFTQTSPQSRVDKYCAIWCFLSFFSPNSSEDFDNIAWSGLRTSTFPADQCTGTCRLLKPEQKPDINLAHWGKGMAQYHKKPF